MRLLPRTLAGRIVFTTVAVAVVATVVAGAVSIGLVRAASLGDARSAVATLADELAALPQGELDQRAELAPTGAGEPKIAVINTNGSVVGSIGVVLKPRVRRQLAQGTSVSTTVALQGRHYLVEARQSVDGDTVVVARTVESVDSAVAAVVVKLLIALGIGLVVAITAGILLARIVSRPLARTAVAARRLARGERGVDLPHAGTVEVSDVVSSLDELDDALTVSEARQKDFLLSISHDLRTPLTALRGYAEALADGIVGPEDSRRVGETMLSETQRLDRFVGDLLELARLEAHDFRLEPSTVDVSLIVEGAVTAWQAVAASNGIDLRSHGRPDLLAETDAHRLRQLIDGLLENALRATPTGGVVQVSVSDAGGSADAPPGAARPPRVGDGATTGIRIVVSDSGPGLSPEDRDVAFVRGALRDRYQGSRQVGTGLGLSIAQRLAGRLGAELTALDASGTPWGTSFELLLPAAGRMRTPG